MCEQPMDKKKQPRLRWTAICVYICHQVIIDLLMIIQRFKSRLKNQAQVSKARAFFINNAYKSGFTMVTAYSFV